MGFGPVSYTHLGKPARAGLAGHKRAVCKTAKGFPERLVDRRLPWPERGRGERGSTSSRNRNVIGKKDEMELVSVKVLVIGGVAAGTKAAAKLKRDVYKRQPLELHLDHTWLHEGNGSVPR